MTFFPPHVIRPNPRTALSPRSVDLKGRGTQVPGSLRHRDEAEG